MNIEHVQPTRHAGGFPAKPMKFLDPSQIEMIDDSLAALGDFGEVRLVVEHGRLRFVLTQCSLEALKWTSGELRRNG